MQYIPGEGAWTVPYEEFLEYIEEEKPRWIDIIENGRVLAQFIRTEDGGYGTYKTISSFDKKFMPIVYDLAQLLNVVELEPPF